MFNFTTKIKTLILDPYFQIATVMTLCFLALWYLDSSSMEQCLQLGNSFSDCEELRR